MGFLTLIAYVALSFFVGLVFIGLFFNLIDINYAVLYLKQEILLDPFLRIALLLSGLLIILLCLRYLQRTIFRRERFVTTESSYGKVSITLFAIEDMLKNMLETQNGLSHVRPRIICKKHGIEVIIRGNLSADANLSVFTKEIQEKTREKLQNLLGEEKEIRIKIEIRKMVFKGKKKIIESTEEISEPEIPYRYY
ncbi:MAG: alkaline shock response membrane anchor protein AmaP [Candidatus Omnitrophota bacterium]